MENINDTPEFGKRPLNRNKIYGNFLQDIAVHHKRNSKSKPLNFNDVSPKSSNISESDRCKKSTSKKKKKSPKNKQSLFKVVDYNTNFQLKYSYEDSKNPLIELLAKKFLIRNDFDRKNSKKFLKEKIQIFEGFDVELVEL